MELTDSQTCLLRNCTVAVTNTAHLTQIEKDLLFYIASGADAKGVYIRTLNFIAKNFICNEAQVTSTINSLNQKGRLFSIEKNTQNWGISYTHIMLDWCQPVPVIPDWLAPIANLAVRQYIMDGLQGHWRMLPESNLSGPERLLCLDLKRRVIALTGQHIPYFILNTDWISHPVLRGETRRDIAGLAKPHRYPRISNIKQYATALSFKEKKAWNNLWN